VTLNVSHGNHYCYYNVFLVWFDSSYVRVSTMTANIDGRSQIKVHTDERTQVHSAQSSLMVTILLLTEVDVA